MSGRIEIATCDACRREGQRVENIVVDGVALRICVQFRACRAAQPTLDAMAGRTGGAS